MSTPRTVKNIAFDSARVTEIPPARTDDRYKNSQLTTIGPAFLSYDETGSTDRWTLGYEEILYVVAGEVTLTVFTHEESYEVKGAEGDVITIGKGSTVEYAGTKGTRVFVVFSPLNWQDLISSVE